MTKRFETILKIVERAEGMGIARGSRVTRMLDMEFADKQFHLRLDDWLDADDFGFAHDFTGIQVHMNRETCLVEDHFVPRFAGHKEA